VALHQRFGFQLMGWREKIAWMSYDPQQWLINVGTRRSWSGAARRSVALRRSMIFR